MTHSSDRLGSGGKGQLASGPGSSHMQQRQQRREQQQRSPHRHYRSVSPAQPIFVEVHSGADRQSA